MAPPLFGCPDPCAGARFAGVLRLQREIDGKLYDGVRCPDGTSVLLSGSELHLGCVSVYDALVVSNDDMLILHLDDMAWWKHHPELGDTLSSNVVDLCAGTGAMSLAAQFLGANPVLAVGWNEKAVELLRANHSGLTLQLDLTSKDAAQIIHRACDGPTGTVFLGFPCQPHSQQGSQQGSADPRAQVLWHGLHITFMLQAQSLILECTPMAGENIDIKDALDSLATAMNWEVQTVTMDLLDVWPCRRNRWWALLFPKRWHSFTMTPWNLHSPFDSIRTILPEWGLWSQVDEMELQLTPRELEMFHDVTYGFDVRNLDLDGTAATFLHSYANALFPCPCGCRLRGFHPLTLRSGGLRGQYTMSQATGRPRYLHPKEVALLLGIPSSFEFIQDVRTSLALLGLVASPLQALWVYGHLLRNHRLVQHQVPCPRVEDWLQAYMLELLAQIPNGFFFQSSWTLDLQATGEAMHMRLMQPQFQVQQLLHAERISLGWNQSCTLLRNGNRLGLDTNLRSDLDSNLDILYQMGSTHRPAPVQDIVVAIKHFDNLQIIMVPPGSFLFEVLAGIGLPLVRKVIDTKEQILPVDLRIWRPVAVTTLVEAPWHQPLGFFRVAHGLSKSVHPGLHDGHVWYGLQTLMATATPPFSSALTLHPALAPALVHQWISEDHKQALRRQYSTADGRILCIFEAAGHWTLLYGLEQAGILHWTLFDGLSLPVSSCALDLAQNVSSVLGLDFRPPHSCCLLPQVESYTCGSVALLHLHMLLNPGFMVLPTVARWIHLWLLAQTHVTGSIFATGPLELSPDQVAKLSQLLRDHGVPESKILERTKQTILKLGAPAIIAAFVAKNSWAHLKAQANKPNIAFRLVQPDELARHAERTAGTKYGAGISNHKAKKKTDKSPGPLPQLDPADLILQPGHFQDEDGEPVPQIAFADLEAEAFGIAIVTVHQGQHLLQQKDSISSKPLAIVTTEELPGDLLSKYDISKIAFPATYTGTGEPVLVFGCLKNLGDVAITRHIAGSLTKVDIIPNVVIRLHIYRDELQMDWQDFAHSPVRQLCQLLPQLQLCPGDGCGKDCPKAHPAVGESLDSVIMEVWGRSFGKLAGGKAPAPDATYFSVFLRIPESQLRPLLQSNVQGIYIDPRQDKAPDDRFRVIWLSSHGLAEAQHACKTCVKALGLVRLRTKYGLRVAAADEEQAFKQLKPDATFIDTRVQRTFQLFPLPHGLQRAGLIRILKDLGWTAKPLQPGKGQQDGISWQVGSTDPPPTNVFSSFGKEVLITETTKPLATPKQASFLASSKTQKHLRSEASSSTSTSTNHDPWQEIDPWNGWKPTTCEASQNKAATGKSHLAEVTGQLKEELQATWRKELKDYKEAQDATMQDVSSAGHEDRFRKIEATMEEIQAQQGQFSQWFSQVGQASTATENAIQTIQYTLNTHQQELQGLHQEIKTVNDNVGHTLQKTLASHQSEMSADFAARFDKLEAMFAKKQRSE
eukprot:s434_g10.t1